jgi:hypothetical protein
VWDIGKSIFAADSLPGLIGGKYHMALLVRLRAGVKKGGGPHSPSIALVPRVNIGPYTKGPHNHKKLTSLIEFNSILLQLIRPLLLIKNKFHVRLELSIFP